MQRLWRGETVSLPGHDGNPVEVHTLPRPVQPELPVWLTSAGSPATFERAGTLGVNVLTHLLGQSIEQLTENLERYRAAWREAGHPGEGRVTLMMHTYLDRDADSARETAREPMKAYLSTAVGLLRDVASAFPTFAGRGKNTDDLFKSLTAEEMDQLLEVAAHRYLSSSGLFGTPADVADVVEQVSAAGVDEVACLIDFGVETDLALSSLDLLLEAKSLVDTARSGAPEAEARSTEPQIDPASDTVAALVAKHGVSHLQCTPSLAAMLVADPADREALGEVQHLMLGGEALSTALAAEIRGLLPRRFTNMYGPTETTIWSLVHEIDDNVGASIPIGTPIGNTTLFVLDRDGGRLGIGAFGELHIGGEGVARGYHNRPELTAERFVERPGMGRVYATGDVVRIHPSGHVEFAGRADNQVKIRGHRIELGEIETVIDRHPDVVQSVVVARTDSGDTRLVAYAIVHHGADLTQQAFADSVRKFVGEVLPDVMVPAAVVRLDAFPLTPNGKIDRKALPAPPSGLMATDSGAITAPPADDVEQLVADVWVSELERPVGRDDNFFDIGGHSLLAVKVFRRLTESVPEKIALTDIFRFPTVRTFAAHLDARCGAVTTATMAPPCRRLPAPTAAPCVAVRWPVADRRGSEPHGHRLHPSRHGRVRHRHRRDGRSLPGSAGRRHAVAARRRRRGLPRRPRRGVAARRRCAGARAERPELRAPQRCARRRRSLRRPVLRDRITRCRDHGSAAPALHRVGVARTRDLGSPAGVVLGFDRRVRRLRHEHVHAPQPAVEPEPGRADGHVPAPPHGQRQGLLHDDAVVPAQPAGAVRQRANGLLDVAGRRSPRGAEPALVRVRPCARGRFDDRVTPPAGVLLPRGRDPRPRWCVPRVRREVGGHRAHEWCRRGRAAPSRRRDR